MLKRYIDEWNHNWCFSSPQFITLIGPLEDKALMACPLLHFIWLVYRDPNMRAHDLLPQRHASTGCHHGDTLPRPRVIYSCCSFSFNGWLHCIYFHKGSRDLYWSLAGTECHRVSLLVSFLFIPHPSTCSCSWSCMSDIS